MSAAGLRHLIGSTGSFTVLLQCQFSFVLTLAWGRHSAHPLKEFCLDEEI
jgi:hypothetical protein